MIILRSLYKSIHILILKMKIYFLLEFYPLCLVLILADSKHRICIALAIKISKNYFYFNLRICGYFFIFCIKIFFTEPSHSSLRMLNTMLSLLPPSIFITFFLNTPSTYSSFRKQIAAIEIYNVHSILFLAQLYYTRYNPIVKWIGQVEYHKNECCRHIY